MKRQNYSVQFKEQVINECRQFGNIALVARRHDLSPNTVYSWLKKVKENGSVIPLPKDNQKQFKEVKKRLNILGTENNQLKKLLAEKELELAILRDLRDHSNPQ